ncbi:MAG TPA: methylated-DNA--[protein]-cysteine S-methyltransferase [Solirubrobacteraceae bacterium]
MGELLLVGDEQGLRALHLPGRQPRQDGWASVSAPFATAVEQLEVYFAGHRTVFDLPLGANGASFDHASGTASPGSHTDRRSATASSRAAWDVPTGVRAVGDATGHNPLAMIVPCHRVVDCGGALGGYGGGLERKRALLALEGAPGSRRWCECARRGA